MADGTDVKSFYETPYFSADKTILNIPTKKTCHILEISKEAEHADITINLPVSIKDKAGNTVSNLEPYTYRINNTIDIIKPVITSVKVYSTGDDSDHFYRQLTDKPFEQWEDEDFYRNLVYQPYIYIQAYDNLSGIKKVHIKETLERTVSELIQDGLVYEADYGINSFAPVTDQAGKAVYNSDGYPLMEYALEYDFNSSRNGLVLLEISVVDNSENESTVSSVEMLEYKNLLNGGGVISTITEDENGIKKLSFGTVSFISNEGFLKDNTVNNFYTLTTEQNEKKEYKLENRERILSMDVYEEGGAHLFTKEKELFNELTNSTLLEWANEYFASYVYKGDKPIYFKITYEDETAFKKEFITALPVSPDAFIIYDSEKNPLAISLNREYPNLNLSPDNSIKTPLYWTYQADINSAESEKTELKQYFPAFLNNKDDGIYRFYYQTQVIPDATNWGSLTGDYGKPVVYYKGSENPNFINNVPFPDFNIPEDSIIYGGRNSGTVKLTVNVTFPQNEYKYFINFRSTKANSKNNYISTEKNFEITSGETYYYSLVAKDSAGNVVANSIEKFVELNKVDNHAPEFSSNKFGIVDSNHMVLSFSSINDKPQDRNINNELEQSIKTIDVFFVPVAGAIDTTVHADEMTDFYFQKITVPFNYSSNTFIVPIDGFREGSYLNYCLFIQDDSELKNFAWYTGTSGVTDYSSIYYTDLKPEITIDSDEMTILSKKYKEEYASTVPDRYKNSLPFNLARENYNELVEAFFDGEKWEYFTTTKNGGLKYRTNMEYDSENKQFKYTKDISSGTYHGNDFHKINVCFRTSSSEAYVYFRPVYIYPDYWRYKDSDEPEEIFCYEKSLLKVQNGYHVFCDAPCLAHTMYSCTQYTQTNTPDDAAEWEARALETGIVTSDGHSFTYTDDNLDAIPAGYYYTTIAHFADGTTVMSEVMQK